MNSMVSRLLRAGVLAGGLVAVGAGVAHADETTSGQQATLSGNQVVAPAAAPVNASGAAVSALDRAVSGSGGGSSTTSPAPAGRGSADPGSTRTTGQGGTGSGNQVVVSITAPVNAGGNTASVLDRSGASGGSTATGSAGGGAGPTATGSSAGDNQTAGDGGTGSGNQVVVPITAPVNAGDNTADVAPASTLPPASPGGPTPTTPTIPSTPATPTAPVGAAPPTTSGASPSAPGEDNSVLGERLSAPDDAVRPASLAMTGGVPMQLVELAALLISGGLMTRWAGRSSEKWLG